MNLLARLSRARVAAEVRFVLGGALAGAAAGLIAGLLGEAPPRLAGGDPLVVLIVRAARGVGLGWWSGLVWSTAFAVLARRAAPAAPVAALPRTAWVAATAVALAALTAHLGGIPVAWGATGGVLVGTVAARLVLARASRANVP